MVETVKTIIIDPVSPTKRMSVVQSIKNPAKGGVVALQSDGREIGDSPSGKFFLTLGALQAAYPTGTVGDSPNVNGILYYWNGSDWETTNIPSNSLRDTGGNIVNPATTEDIMKLMRYLSVLTIKDSSGRQRVTIDNIIPSVVIGSGTVTAVTTVGTITNIPTIGGMGAELLQRSMMRNAFANSVRSRLSYT